MGTKLITVIVPVYRVEEYLSRCLDSLLKQTYKNLEIILVDDGSPDHSGEICDHYAQIDTRIQVIHKKNGGVSSARNQALYRAKGDYIGFVDPDDYLEDNMFEQLYQNIQTYQADIAICGFYFEKDTETQRNNLKDQCLVFDSNQAIRTMLNDEYYGFLWNRLFDKKVFFNESGELEIFDESIYLAEDTLMNCNCMLRSAKIVYDTTPLYHYTVRTTGSCKSEINDKKLTMIKSIQIMQDKIRYYCPELEQEFHKFYLGALVSFICDISLMPSTTWSKNCSRYLRSEYTLHLWDCGFNFKQVIKYCIVTLFPRAFGKYLNRKSKW